ncbi:MAG: NUDIX domain-containing protein [Ornithinimicrobium sp.]
MRARVEAHDADGIVRYNATLGHGEDPKRTLAILGWEPRWLGARGDTLSDGTFEVVLRYVVHRGDPAYPYQRLAGYAVVIAHVEGERCLLLTSFTHSRSGQWGLPGGGIDEGEDPLEAVHREVWEETGQRITITKPYEVDTSHFAGRSPRGRFENYHAVRLIYTARCPEPVEPVVHDVGGSTDQAAWVPIGRLDSGPPLQPWGRAVINGVLSQPRL